MRTEREELVARDPIIPRRPGAPVYTAPGPCGNTCHACYRVERAGLELSVSAAGEIQPDGWVILHAGRALKGMDAQEFATMVAGVGRFADQFDDQLIAEFYADQPDATNQAPVT